MSSYKDHKEDPSKPTVGRVGDVVEWGLSAVERGVSLVGVIYGGVSRALRAREQAPRLSAPAAVIVEMTVSPPSNDQGPESELQPAG